MSGLVFYPKSHRYKLDGAWVPGVTTLLGKGLPKPAIPYWAARTVAEWVADNPDLTEDLKRMGGRGPAVAFLKELPWQKRDEAAIRGTDVHALAERIVHGEEVEVPDHLTGYVQGYVDWLDASGFQPILTERSCASRQWGYAGTFDAIGTFGRGPLAGQTVLADWKTSSGVYGETALQTATYASAEFYNDTEGHETPMPEVTATGVVHVQDGHSELYVLAYTPAEIAEAFKVFTHVAYVAKRVPWIGDRIGEPIALQQYDTEGITP